MYFSPRSDIYFQISLFKGNRLKAVISIQGKNFAFSQMSALVHFSVLINPKSSVPLLKYYLLGWLLLEIQIAFRTKKPLALKHIESSAFSIWKLLSSTLKGLRGVIFTPSGFFWINRKRVEIFQRHFSYS